ncbi:PREDICTED: plasminogen activator inhibitor 1 RNA-binding protein [Rhagoletis zephyria]|uniref:plasminogen activator inhibitor 1 RNA-binding protein n=1 Tax=Rhagoletis zephyria TaxID=28612 RepID=UPI000811610E|nr:PREDICTED: plasminogen activator inhibitor 1 RNA-binding protein [Rhagoletis zephyria]XP_036342794.1 plasminogen activator inhibitor 1 RNA-binding protein-like [Rhagoletis pomonella]XP_036342797.1 plasminogen activator inhibitor 1 RNA-binding protein-like [Rhagoletis pomonella]
MDGSGNNRYELLFMDDDISDPLDNIAIKSKKQVKTAGGSGGSAPLAKSSNKQNVDSVPRTQSSKKPNQAEKENKPSALNKNEVNKKSTAGTAADRTNKQGGPVANANRKRTGPASDGGQGGQQQQGTRNLNFRQQNGETREQRNNRRNVRENGFTGNFGMQIEGGSSQQQPRQFRERENRGPPRNRNFEGGNRGGKREFDRQSGSDKTGVKAIDKRDGAGAHNWGSVKEAIDDVNKSDVEAGNVTDKAEESGNEQADQAPVEEETKELTLDEWKAQKQQRVKPTFNIRKAGEGEDTTQWKKMVVLNNNKKKDNESEEELEYDPAMYPQRVGRQQRVLDIQFNFNDGRRGPGFGGRGRGRGPRPGAGVPNTNTNFNNATERPVAGGRGVITGRGGKRNFGFRQQNIAPKVNDERQFPTLA